jgi:hypothetical protein
MGGRSGKLTFASAMTRVERRRGRRKGRGEYIVGDGEGERDGFERI